MAAPVDPFPNFVPAALADGDQVDARFTALFTALDRSKVSGGLDAASIKDGIVVPGLTVIDPFQSLAVAGFSGWSIDFHKDLMGITRIRRKAFVAAGGVALTNGATLFTLPVGYRPGVLSVLRLEFYIPAGGGSQNSYCAVTTGGVVTYEGTTATPSAGNVLLVNGHFKAEN